MAAARKRASGRQGARKRAPRSVLPDAVSALLCALPAVMRELERIAGALERAAAALEHANEHQAVNAELGRELIVQFRAAGRAAEPTRRGPPS